MKRSALCFLSFTLLSGCVSTPTTKPGQKEFESASLGLGASAAPTIDAQWWKAFGDPQLDTLVGQALAGNPDLQAALARMRTAEAGVAAARAQTYPQATFDAQDVRERFSKDYVFPPPYGGTWRWFGTEQASLTYTLDLFGKEATQIAEARDTAEAAALDATAARLALAGSVTEAYVALNRAWVLADVAEETVQQRQGVYDLTAGRVRAGLDTDASQKEAEALLATAKEDLIRAQSEREMDVHAIAALAGRGADAYAIARPRLASDALSLPEAIPADLLARRADIAAAKTRIAAAGEARELAHKEYYPDVNLTALAGTAAIGLSPLFSAAAAQYGIGPAIHLPIFDAGKIGADEAGATAGLDEAVANYNDDVTAAVKQTADAIITIRSLEHEAGLQRQALAASQASFALARERYRSGLSPQLNVLQVEDIVIAARRQDATLDSDIAAARVALVMALGGGFSPAPDPAVVTSDARPTHE